MTGTQTSASAWMLTGCLSLLALSPCWQPAQAQGPEQIPFRIDAGTLGPALHAYGRATGIAVMLDDRYSDRPVQAVAGSYTASAAMQRLLSGTGLLARFIGGDAVIVYAPQSTSEPSAARPSAQASYGDYVARLQTEVTQVLCRQPQTRPGRYRLALQMRLDGVGQVAGLRLLDSTGEASRDQAVASALQALSFAPPPPAMPQPVLLLLVPDGPGALTRCPSSLRTEH
mgnify:CR=1 FL=1